ncbi:chromosome partitioning protein [Lachnospiraceae bacterium KH1T2]|nr:chromosome partitioning protein [Lachnospiraceae bacterium KH1T2]
MQELVGLSEIAEIAGASNQTVSNWKKRYEDFPEPIAQIKAGEFYDKDHIVKWLKRKGKIMGAKIVAFINLKGGVAKTTTTVGTATVLAGTFGKKVLVIDLDPQTNCTTMLIGEEKWKELNNDKHTLYTLFKDALDEKNNFDIEKTLQKSVSNIRDVNNLDLLPSSLDMVDLQDRIATAPQGQFYANNPTEIIKRAVKNIKNDYDYILIDCPPNMGLITLNGLRIADGYVIPTIPDVLSTYGIPQIINRVNKFSDSIGEEIECLGIVATKVRMQSSLHNRTLNQLRMEKDAPMFKTVFYENNQMGEAAEYQPIGTLRQKWGYQGQYDRLEAFTIELMDKLEA